MADPLHILIVGHDLQAKCNVANAFIKQKHGFKQFLCRHNLLVKKIFGGKSTHTVAGRQLNIVLTPNLNTPGWTHMTDGIFSRYTNRVFVYVKSPGRVRVNDDESINNIKAKFRKPNVQTITYFDSATDAESAGPDNMHIHARMSFKDQTSNVDRVLAAIGKSLQKHVKVPYRGPEAVGSVSVSKQERSQTSSSGSSNEEKDEEPESKLDRQDTDQLEMQENVESKHWDLLSRTLRYGRAKSNHVRVNIIGNQGAGKTTLVSRLHRMDVRCPDELQKPTEALEINELSSRCIEVDGKKKWDTNTEGYVEDLNVQRMAQAMKNVEKDLEGKADRNSEDIIEESFDVTDYTLGSYIEEDIEIIQQEPYAVIDREQSRVRYITKILRKKNHSRGERMYVSYWDFAGQSTYYSTHQVFMSPSAVYVLVVDLSMNFKEKLSDSLTFRTGIIKDCSVSESLMFWISSIKAFATDAKGGKAPVLIVGTHIDKLKLEATKKNLNPEEEINKKFDEVREILKMSEVECIAVDNTNQESSDLDALKNRILELGLGVIDEEIPAQWIDLERRIQEQRIKGNVIMTFSELKLLDESMDVPMKENARLEAFLGHQHNRGHLIYFLHDDLKDLIILEPDVLAKFLNNLMRSRDNVDQRGMRQHTTMYNHNGIVNQNYVIETAKMMSEYRGIEANVDKLLNMLVHLSVIRPYKLDSDGTRYLLPCLLPHRAEEEWNKKTKSVVETKSFQVVFPNNHMPPTFYHILVGGLLNEWKLIEKSVDVPEIYNLYACFRLDAETQQMEIYWKESCVYIDIKNYSTKKELKADKMFEILEILKKRIVTIFRVYRHTNTNYETRVQCPKHRNYFVSLATLSKDGEAMCYSGKSRHAVEFEKVFGKELLAKERPDFLKRKPTDIDLGRLATYLVREDATSLASRLRIHLGLVEADRAVQSASNNNDRRLRILYRWRGSYGSGTIGDLIELLTVTKDYQTDDLQNLLEASPERRNYEIPDDKLDCIPENKCDIKIASNSIGALYPFLMLELGLHVSDIERVWANNRNDMWQTIYTLLVQWRQQHPRGSTTRVLLDTASFVGIDTTQMQKEIRRT